MNRRNVASTNLASIGYDPNSQTLEVEFRNGSIYRYLGVSPFEHSSLMGATSHGSYFSSSIRGRYHTVRLR